VRFNASMSGIAQKLAAIARLSDQKTKIEKYKFLLGELFEAPKAPDFKAFVQHMVADDMALLISRQILSTYAQRLKELPADLHKDIATLSLEAIEPSSGF